MGCAAGSAEAESVATVQAEAVVSVKLGVLKQLIEDTISEVDAKVEASRKAPKDIAEPLQTQGHPFRHPFRNLVEEPRVLQLVLEHMAGVGLVAVVDGASPTGTRADDVVFSFPKALRLG